MKLIYSELKKLLPNLDYPAQKIADDLTLISHLSEGTDVTNNEKVINLEIPKDRGDCLGYYGLAKEISVLHNLKLELPKIDLPKSTNKEKINVFVSAEKEVIRLMALKIKNVSNKPSPTWLKHFLELHEINSVNTLVDLTNYIMLIYGIPCHAFDAAKASNQLQWQINSKKDQITTLDGTNIEIPAGSLVITDPVGTASLSIIGGRRTAIDLETTETIIEMAVYLPKRVRLDAKNMNIITEASIRLEKNLDPELIPQAFNHLISLILENCDGEINSQTFDYYPNKPSRPKIEYNPNKPAAYAGIDIPEKYGLEILEKLDCQIEKENNKYQIIPPTLRTDLNLEEDLIEEVVRFYGYNKIPTDEPISSQELPDITPKILYLINSIKNSLVNFGYDEIRSWPIIREENFHQPTYLPKKAQPIYTENNVNSEYPLLRMSLASSLYLQTVQAQKLKLPDQKFFEVGKTYYQLNKNYLENYTVSIYQPNFQQLEEDIQEVLTGLGINVNQYSVEIINNKKFIELNLNKISDSLDEAPLIELNTPEKQTGQAIELNRQIINLDANVILDKKVKPEKLIKKYQAKIDPNILWKLEIIDIYQTEDDRYKYTFRAYYYNAKAAVARKIHMQAFQLS